MLRRHIPLHAETGYKPAQISRCHMLGRVAGPVAARLIAKVRWQEKEEPADEDGIPSWLIEDYRARREAMGHIQLGKDKGTRKDEGKTNLQRQGHWTPLCDKTTSALLHEPELRKCITINSTDVINPDHDIAAPGTYTM